jgi:hypothetical protein
MVARIWLGLCEAGMAEIRKWADIEKDFIGGTILLGNGASMAVWGEFGYKNLWSKAKDIKAFSDDVLVGVDDICREFATWDFEYIMRLLWQTSLVNNCLVISDDKTSRIYSEVRGGLIKAVRAIHPRFDDVSGYMDSMCRFLRGFDTILSLNYDLLVYWCVIQEINLFGLGRSEGHVFKDCFSGGGFDGDWRKFRNPIYGQKRCSLVFYPHGNLALSRCKDGREMKIHRDDNHLLESILKEWEGGDGMPLFVSEGRSQQKISSIHSSNYLSTVYWEVLGGQRSSLVIYGWGVAEQDHHLLERMKGSGIEKVAVSVHNGDQDYIFKVENTLRRYFGQKFELSFFDSNSPGCWIYPDSP